MPRQSPQILIGTSGWNYPGWQELLYKKKMPGIEQLGYYSTIFDTVENNSSFYHVPRQTTLQKWHDATAPSFVISLKLNKTFTHENKLLLNNDLLRQLRDFMVSLQALGPKLGAVLIQTPPALRYSYNLVEEFLQACLECLSDLQYKPDLAIEFRNQAWFNDNVYQLLNRLNIAFVIGQSSRYPYERVVTADFCYVRFHGPMEMFTSPYSEAELDGWHNYLAKQQNLRRIYVYFNNTRVGHAISNAQYLSKLIHYKI